MRKIKLLGSLVAVNCWLKRALVFIVSWDLNMQFKRRKGNKELGVRRKKDNDRNVFFSLHRGGAQLLTYKMLSFTYNVQEEKQLRGGCKQAARQLIS